MIPHLVCHLSCICQRTEIKRFCTTLISSFVSPDELRGLEWCTRFKIMKGICEGLRYLHKEKHIIHMDLKPANILVDDHMVPKITDFGVSKLAEISHTLSNDRIFSP